MTVFTVAVFNDIHFKLHDERLWWRTKDICTAVRPVQTIFNGDVVDLASLSSYGKGSDTELNAVSEIALAVSEIKDCQRLWGGKFTVIGGNHDIRWERMLVASKQYLKGAKGLALSDQFYAQGLPRNVTWIDEDEDEAGWEHAKSGVWVRHGHNQAGKYGIKNIAAGSLAKFPSTRQVEGHHHRAQLMYHTERRRISWSVANPHLSKQRHNYNITPNWQQGFVLLNFYGGRTFESCTECSPELVVADMQGRLVCRGKVYT